MAPDEMTFNLCLQMCGSWQEEGAQGARRDHHPLLEEITGSGDGKGCGASKTVWLELVRIDEHLSTLFSMISIRMKYGDFNQYELYSLVCLRIQETIVRSY